MRGVFHNTARHHTMSVASSQNCKNSTAYLRYESSLEKGLSLNHGTQGYFCFSFVFSYFLCAKCVDFLG